MFDFASLIVLSTATVGLAALLSTDPVVIQKVTVPTLVEYQGYKGELVSKILRDRIRAIARSGSTARDGDNLSKFNANDSEIDVLVDRLGISAVVEAFRGFLGFEAYSMSGYIAYTDHGMKMGLKGTSAHDQMFALSVSRDDYDVPALVNDAAERFVERVDPYVLTLYYFRQEYDQGQFTKTLPMIKHCMMVLPPGQAMTWPMLLWGRVLYRQGQYDEAIIKYRQILALNPNHVLAAARWGEALIAKGEIDTGLDKMQQAIAKVDFDPTLLRLKGWPTAHTLLGDTLVKFGRDEEARDIYVKGMILVPTNPYLQTSLGKLYLKHKQYDPAIRLFKQALDSHPNRAIPAKLLDEALAAKFAHAS